MKKIFFGKNLRFLRKRNRINQQAIAEHVGKRQTTIGNWENGVTEPRPQDILLLAKFFDVSEEDLLFKDLAPLENLEVDPSAHSTGAVLDGSVNSVLSKVFQNGDVFALETAVNEFLSTPGVVFKDAKYLSSDGGNYTVMIFYERYLS